MNLYMAQADDKSFNMQSAKNHIIYYTAQAHCPL